MENVISTILILAIVFGGLFWYFKRKGALPNIFSGFSSGNPSATEIQRIKTQTELEREKGKLLLEHLNAKAELMEQRARNKNIQQDTAQLSPDNVMLIAKRYPSNGKKEKTKVL